MKGNTMFGIKKYSRVLLLSTLASAALFASPSKIELDNMTKIVGYFPEWGIYDGHNNYAPEDVPFAKITHLNYAFATIKDGLIADFDNYAANEVTHGEAWDSPYKGNLGQFEKLKKDYPHLSVMVSVGGWSQSGNFHDVAATQTARDQFAASVIQYIRTHKMDGVDIDWEYPGASREPDLSDNPNDQGTPNADASEKETFRLLLQTLRAHLDTAGTQDGKYYQLTAAVSAAFVNIDFSEPQNYAQYLDFLNIMTYDMHSAWDGVTNHQSALYPKAGLNDNLNVQDVVEKFISLGVDKKKLIVGTPFYSRGWKGVVQNNPSDGLTGLLAQASGGANGVWDGGVAGGMNPYYHLVDMENDPSFVKYYDSEAEAPYLYSAEKQEFYTYENKRSLGAKVDYVKNNQLGGMIIWELSADVPSADSRSLLNVIYQGFYPNGISAESNTPTGNTDNTSDTNTTQDGTDTNTTTGGDTGNTATVWSAEAVYTAGDIVSYNNTTYKAKWWTQGDIPGTEEYGPWEVVGTSTTDNTTGNNDNNTTGGGSEDNNNDSNTTDSGSMDNNTTSGGTNPVSDNDTWNAETVYTGGEVIVYTNKKYEAQWWTQGDIPGSEEWGPWKEVSDTTPVTDTGSETNTSGTVDETNTTESTNTQTVSLAQLEEDEAALTNTPQMNEVKASIRTLPNSEVEQIIALRAENPSNVKRIETIVSAEDWEYLFPQRSPEYTYENFLKAAGKFPAFCGDYDDGRDAGLICRQSLATMFAHFTQETGGHTSGVAVPEWRQGLVYVRELGWNETMKNGYNSECNPTIWQGKRFPCGTFEDGDYKSYFGRGAKQLSYNYNYGPFSEAMTGDVHTLLDNPELVADTWYNLASAVFFFVYPQPPKPSMLHVVDGTWVANANDVSNGLVPGFGATTNIINGGVECGGSTEISQSLNRITYYKEFSNYLGNIVADDEVLGCANMKQFSSDGAGALPIYWEEDWSWSSETSDGRSYKCQLVNYQTPYSAFKEGDYKTCVEETFNVIAE